MPSCCQDDYARMFGRGSAERDARRVLRRGVRGSAATLATGVERAGVDGASVIEVGGGVGGLHTRLLQHGAGRVVNVELSPGWEQPAHDVLVDLDLVERVERRLGDFVAMDDLAPAEVVVLHRVVCCYPDWRAMLDRAASLATNTLGFTFPRDRWANRFAIAVGNGVQSLLGHGFRAFVHPAHDMLELLVDHGFEVVADDAGIVWRTVVATR